MQLGEFPSWNPVVQTPKFLWEQGRRHGGYGKGWEGEPQFFKAEHFCDQDEDWVTQGRYWKEASVGSKMDGIHILLFKNIYWPDPGFYQYPSNGHQAENQSPLDPFWSIV